MKPSHCPTCLYIAPERSKIVRYGVYFRTSDSKTIQRFRCQTCRRGFSLATFNARYRQKKRLKNDLVRKLLCSGVSQRRIAKVLRLHRTTVAHKFRLLALEAEFELRSGNLGKPKARVLEFDDLETFEHTKCKPLSVTLAVESGSRRILGLEVSQMPARGPLARIRKYPPRPDERHLGRERLFGRIRDLVDEKELVLKSDSNPHYPKDVEKFFPTATHRMFLGKRGASTGQGELKKVKFDPLFSLNHTCAKLRADVNRLIRKTWCTTKKREYLYSHLILYASYHNQMLA